MEDPSFAPEQVLAARRESFISVLKCKDVSTASCFVRLQRGTGIQSFTKSSPDPAASQSGDAK